MKAILTTEMYDMYANSPCCTVIMHNTKYVWIFLEVSFDHRINFSSYVLFLYHLLLAVSWKKKEMLVGHWTDLSGNRRTERLLGPWALLLMMPSLHPGLTSSVQTFTGEENKGLASHQGTRMWEVHYKEIVKIQLGETPKQCFVGLVCFVLFCSLDTDKWAPPVKVTLGSPILVTDFTIHPVLRSKPSSHTWLSSFPHILNLV